MSVSDKTRKILWGRSGNRCAFCRRGLVVERTALDDESVVGEECHIVSEKLTGPRANPDFPRDRIDEPDNLILFCRVHHKMVDDQEETYDPQLLTVLKQKHEGWVSVTLGGEPRPVRLRRDPKQVPTHLVRVTGGQQLTDIVYGAGSFSFRHDELESEAEMELVSSFLQEAQEWGEILAELEAGERVRIAFQMTTRLRELERGGFYVFGATEKQRLEGGVGPPMNFSMAILHVVRSTNPTIIKFTVPSSADEEVQQGETLPLAGTDSEV